MSSIQVDEDVEWGCTIQINMKMHYIVCYVYTVYTVQQCHIIEWSFTLLCQSWNPCCVEVQYSTSLQSTRSLDPLPCQAWHSVPLAQGARHRGSEELIPAWSLGSHQVRGGQASISPIISFPHIYTFVWGQVFQYQVIETNSYIKTKALHCASKSTLSPNIQTAPSYTLSFVANIETISEQFEEKINVFISKNIFDTFGTDFLAHISRLGKPGGIIHWSLCHSMVLIVYIVYIVYFTWHTALC